MPQQVDGFYLPTAGFDGNRADELIERIAVIRVDESEITVNTERFGKTEATVVTALTVDPDTGEVVNWGRMPIFWQHVRNQLSRTPEGEWTAGVISKPEGWDAYRMDAPDPSAYPMIKAAIRGDLPPVFERDDSAEF